MLLSELPTPQLLIDRRRLLNNIDRVQQLATHAGMALRPHAKTHKSPIIARWQIERGAVGICCAKIGEAEAMAAAGIDNIRLAYPIQPSNAGRLIALMDRAVVSIVIDHLAVARRWSEAMTLAGRILDVLIEVDVGFHRCGIAPEPPGSVAFIQMVASLPGLRLRGLLSHAGHGYRAASEAALRDIAVDEVEMLTSLRDRAASVGVVLDELSVGATPTLRYTLGRAGPTEVRPGNYVFFDRTQVALGAASLDDCALTVLATVVSKPAGDRIVLDCGSKTLTSDLAGGFTAPGGYGAVLTMDGGIDDNLRIERLSEEHAIVHVSNGTPLEPGDRVRVLPNHACVVVNMVDEVRLVDGDVILENFPVAARGRIT